MESNTFRAWLAERGCKFHSHEQHGRAHGHPLVTVRLGKRSAELPNPGAHQNLDLRIVQKICADLGLDASELPGPESRV
jgi:hypothetical protein